MHVTPCSPFRVEPTRTKNQHERAQAGILLGLFFDHEYEGDMLFLNVGLISTDYTTSYPTVDVEVLVFETLALMLPPVDVLLFV